MNPGRKNAIVIFITIAATIAIVATISTMSCSSSEPLPPIAVVVAVVAVAVVPVVAVVAFVVVAVVVAPCPWPSPSPWPPAGLAAGFALRVGFPCRSLLLLNGSAVGCWCGFCSLGFCCWACCHLPVRVCTRCSISGAAVWFGFWFCFVFCFGSFISSIPVIMVIIVKPIIMVIIIIPSSFLSARVFSRSRKIPPYSTVDTRQRPIESSTHVDGNEITVQREQNRRNLGIVC